MDEVAPASDWTPLPRRLRRTCPLGVVQVMPGRFAILHRRSGTIVEAGFNDFEGAWARVAQRLEGTHDF
jgi:hypothetical protein